MKTNFSLISYGLPQQIPDRWLLMLNSQLLINRIYYILREGAGYIKDSKKIPFKKGHFYFIPNNCRIEYYLEDEHFSHAYIDFCDSKHYPCEVITINPSDYPVLKSEIDVFLNFLYNNKTCITKHHNPDLYYDTVNRMKCILCSFLCDINDITDYKHNENHAIVKSIEYIRSNYMSDIKLKDLAQKSAFSTTHYIRLFKEHTGLSPHQYIKKHRIDMALEFLKTDMSITEIAEKCGFLSVASFSNTFKKTIGQKPSNFRDTKS